jgi:hypothetical protein
MQFFCPILLLHNTRHDFYHSHSGKIHWRMLDSWGGFEKVKNRPK